MVPPPLINNCLRYIGSTLISVALIYGIGALSAAASPKTRTHLPTNSIAVSDDALATFFNPSGLGTGRGLNLYYLRTYQSTWAGDDAFFLAVPNGGFGVEFATADADTTFTRYTLSGGRHLGHSLYWGTSYSWINSDDKSYDTFRSVSLGLMYRRRYLSVGAMGRDLNQPKLFGEKLGRTYNLGLAIRPGTWRTTLSIDMQKTQGIEGVDLQYALTVRPIREVMLQGTLNSDLSFDVRFGINIGNWGFGTGNTFDENREAQTGVGYFHFSNTPTTKRLPRRRMFLDLQMHSVRDVLSIAKSDEDVAGVLVRINGHDYGMAQLQEMTDAILNFRESGRAVLCYITTQCSTGDYIVASACDSILIHPFAEVRLIGLRAESSFYKRALDMLGIRANLEHIGKYKSGAEAFTRKEMSEAEREIQNIILDDLYEQLVEAIAKGRGWTPEDVKKHIDEGPYTALQAFRTKLVDQIANEGHLKGAVTKLTDKHTDLVSLNEYAERRLHAQDWRVPQPKIAIIEAKGLMVTGDSFIDPLTGTQVMGADTIVEAIRAAKDDDAIKAVVLRIDSGGGLVVAADIIWQALVPLTKIKPVVVSMGDVAASGGYYIAAPAKVIIAEPGTITGSIGVIGGKYSLKGLYEKLGIQKEILKRGKHADFYSDYSDYPPSEQEIIRQQIKEIYNDFITKVAAGRSKLTTPEVDKLGRGRIWSGRQAYENGLVDELGGLNRALAIAREYAGLEEKRVEIIRFPKQTWASQLVNNLRFSSVPLYQTVSEGIGGEREAIALPLIARYGGFNDALKLINIIRQHRLFLLMPYQIAMGR